MKQIIVDVSGLSVEEKQRVNEALAKIKGVSPCNPYDWNKVAALYGPSLGGVNVGFSTRKDSPTHTPQQVLEMTGIAINRKVRKDFDPKRVYSVNVSGCTEDEKKKVQQAFLDVGFPWWLGGKKYQHLDAAQYSNTTAGKSGRVTTFCMYTETTEGCNMKPEEFFSYVYEPVQQGHIHAELMAMYAKDAKTTDKPWELWQLKDIVGNWITTEHHPAWEPAIEYRRKPKTKLIHGIEIPDISIDLSLTKERTDFYAPCTHSNRLFIGLSHHYRYNDRSQLSTLGLTYPYTEEGKQAAILHAKAMLGIN